MERSLFPEMIQPNGRLSQPMVALLHQAFSFDRKSLTTSIWMKYDSQLSTKLWARITGIPERSLAAVMGNIVVHDGSAQRSDMDWFRLMVHEQAHRHQIAVMGAMPFYAGYLKEAVMKPYKDISFEQEAFSLGADSAGKDKALQLWRFRHHSLREILGSQISVTEKVDALTELGKAFRIG
jgi:hypothetical protein